MRNPLLRTLFVLLACLAVWQEARLDAQPLRIGVNPDYAPLSYGHEGEARGYLVEIAQAVAQEMGREATFVLGGWGQLEADLQSGQIDLLFGLYHTREREALYAFGPEVFRNRVYFYAKRDGRAIDSVFDAFGRSVGVSGPESVITRRVQAEYPEIQWEVFPNLASMAEAVVAREELVGFVEEEALVQDWGQDSSRYIDYYRAGGALMSGGLRPVSRRADTALMTEVARAYASLEPQRLTDIRSRWLGVTSTFAESAVERPLTLSEEEKDFLARHPVIRFAGDSDWPPIAFRRASGDFQGVQADFLAEIEGIIGIRFEYPVFEDWPAVQSAIERGEADFSSSDTSVDNTTQSYWSVPLALVVNREEAARRRLDELDGQTVSVEDGNAFVATLRSRYPEIAFRLVATEQAGLDLLLSGEVSGHVGNFAVCVHLIQTRYVAALTVSEVLETTQELAFRVRSEPEWAPLIAILNKAIGRIDAQRRQQISNRWIDATALDRRHPWADLWKPLAALAALLAVVLAWRLTTRKLRRALAHAEERLLLAQKLRAGGLFEWYPREERAVYSREYFKILGYDEDELPHTIDTFVRLIHPRDLKRAWVVQRQCTARGEAYEHMFRMRRKDGNWAWIWARGIPTHLYGDGSVKRYIGLQADITPLRAASDALRRQDARSRRASRAKSEFLANMSHEIRTPMNAILGFARLLTREQSLTSQQAEYVHLINRSGEHLLALLDDILDMAKIEAGRTQVDWDDWNVARLFSDVCRIFLGRCEEAGLDFSATYDSELPELAEIDGSKLRQALSNLLSNAIKFTQRGGIEARATPVRRGNNEPWIRIDIVDTGCGIGEEEIGRLFSAFSQGEAGRSTAGGTGLGLAISREFCQLMGGSLTVASDLGQGSTFTIELPLRPARSGLAVNDTEASEVEVDAEQAKELRVLVVDDNRFSLQYMDRFLSSHGFSIRLAEDGVEAIVMWKLYEPHIILLDLRMPKKDGYAVIEEIRKMNYIAQPRIMVLTASAFSDQRQRVLDLGADDFLGKPFRESELLRRLCRLTGLECRELGVGGVDAGGAIEPLKAIKSVQLEAELRSSLVAACRGGYVKRIDELIDQLEPRQPEASKFLRSLAANFDYDRILAILSASPAIDPKGEL